MSVVDDLIARADALTVRRASFERIWRDVAEVVMPSAPDFDTAQSAVTMTNDNIARTSDRSSRIYDSTGVWAADRLAAGIESLVTPQSEKWHDLAFDDPLAGVADDDGRIWLDRLRDVLFAIRYEPGAGFVEANQQALRSVVSLGTGLIFVDEGVGRQVVRYRPMPLSECYLDVDCFGQVDTVCRLFALTARQARQQFGDNLSAAVAEAAVSEKDKDRLFAFLHVVQPREETGSRRQANRNLRYASYYVELDERQLVADSGFFEFPYIDYRWSPQPGCAYGEGPVMQALADIKTLNAMSMTALRAGQQAVDPPLAIADDGVINRPNLNARAINYGGIDQNGRLRIQPIITARHPDLAEAIMNQRRDAVRESLFINLFQALTSNPGMSATEALIRSNEKGQLLGPAGARIQNGLARMIEREFGILRRRGLFEHGDLVPPDGVPGNPFSARFTSPLDRMRRSSELVGLERTLELATRLGQIDPGVFDNIDADEALRLSADVNGAPQRMLRSAADRDELRQQRSVPEAEPVTDPGSAEELMNDVANALQPSMASQVANEASTDIPVDAFRGPAAAAAPALLEAAGDVATS